MNFSESYEALQQLPQPEFLYLCVATLALLFILILLVRRQPKKIVAYSTENGRVMVSRHAIVELVQTSCEQLQDVSKPQIKINIKGQTAHFEIRVKLLSSGRLRQVEQTLQAHLRKALSENLGIESLGQINIVATGFKSGRIESNIPAKAKTHADESTPSTNDAEALALETDADADTNGTRSDRANPR